MRTRSGRRTASLLTSLAVCALVTAATTAFTTPADAAPTSATAVLRQHLNQAVAYARSRGESTAIAVYDTRTNGLFTAGKANTYWATESLVKVFIATRLLLTGQMHGSVAATAYKMITQSDDASATALYGRAGGDGLEPWIAAHYHIKGLGAPPIRSGWWGNTHITARGMVIFYAKVKKDPKVGPWLLNAMSHTTKYGSDSTYQYFGIPAATSGFAIKQGWGADGDCACQTIFNSTGFVQGERYAIAILTAGGSYGTHAEITLNGIADRILPIGYSPTAELTSKRATAGQARFGGYGFDLDVPSQALTVTVYRDGKRVLTTRTTVPTPGLNKGYHLTGRHGFTVTVKSPAGKHRFCIWVANVGQVGKSQQMCRILSIPAPPPPKKAPPTKTPPPSSPPASSPPASSAPASTPPAPTTTAPATTAAATSS